MEVGVAMDLVVQWRRRPVYHPLLAAAGDTPRIDTIMVSWRWQAVSSTKTHNPANVLLPTVNTMFSKVYSATLFTAVPTQRPDHTTATVLVNTHTLPHTFQQTVHASGPKQTHANQAPITTGEYEKANQK